MNFDLSLIGSYTIDELLIFLKNGDVTLERLSNHLIGDNYLVLVNRIRRFRELKEEDDWNSVKNSNANNIKDFLSKYPDSIHFYEALRRKEYYEEQERIIAERRMAYRPCCIAEGKNTRTEPKSEKVEQKHTYIPKKVLNWFNGKINSNETLCNSAVFAPAEIVEGEDMFVQVYIYKDEETDQVVLDSITSDKHATQRSYTPLYFKVKTGDKITVKIDMHGLSVDGETSRNMIWHNKFTKCCFFVYIPMHYQKIVKGDVYISVNGLEFGQMSFFSRKKKSPDDSLYSEVISNLYRKVFISYSHKDEDAVKPIAEAYKALGVVDYFYDRHSLFPGDIFEKKIYKFIDDSDLFLLCWSENAACSEWVKKERIRAFYLALDAPPRLKLYPINIPPYSPPPPDMINIFHFTDYDK